LLRHKKTGYKAGLICKIKNDTVMFPRYFKNGVSALLLLLVAATGVWAHPGHGETEGHSVAHYLTETFHVIPLVAVIILSVAIFSVIYARRKIRSVANA